jgi:hypothetical protein
LVVLLGVCASVLPIPLPSPPSTDKDRSEPFPCQNRPCGCRSAEQCWKKCCCFTNSQKLAWAKANRVSAPQHVHLAAAQESKSSSCRKPCCAQKSMTGICGRSSELSDEQCGLCPKKAAAQHSQATDASSYVIGALAEQCQGQSSFWNSLPWAVMPDNAAFNVCCGVAAAAWEESSIRPTITYRPPIPPPRGFGAFLVI